MFISASSQSFSLLKLAFESQSWESHVEPAEGIDKLLWRLRLGCALRAARRRFGRRIARARGCCLAGRGFAHVQFLSASSNSDRHESPSSCGGTRHDLGPLRNLGFKRAFQTFSLGSRGSTERKRQKVPLTKAAAKLLPERTLQPVGKPAPGILAPGAKRPCDPIVGLKELLR